MGLLCRQRHRWLKKAGLRIFVTWHQKRRERIARYWPGMEVLLLKRFLRSQSTDICMLETRILTADMNISCNMGICLALVNRPTIVAIQFAWRWISVVLCAGWGIFCAQNSWSVRQLSFSLEASICGRTYKLNTKIYYLHYTGCVLIDTQNKNEFLISRKNSFRHFCYSAFSILVGFEESTDTYSCILWIYEMYWSNIV